MRIMDDRYSRDRYRLELALRFLHHEARTQTIRVWTGLSDDRIRKLYRSLTRARGHVPRHRGKSPHQVAYFTRSNRLQQETTTLASLMLLLGVVPNRAEPEPAQSVPGVARGELLCQAFEAYRAFIPSSQISFEHAVFLTLALARGDQLRLAACRDCGSLVVVERFPVKETRCHHCHVATPSRW